MGGCSLGVSRGGKHPPNAAYSSRPSTTPNDPTRATGTARASSIASGRRRSRARVAGSWEAPGVSRRGGRGALRLGPLLALIHPSAWKRNSAKFKVAGDPPSSAASIPRRHFAEPSAPKRGDLVAFVAALCIKVLRLVTLQLPEKSLPSGRGSTELRVDGVLRSCRQK